ncbi:MAG: hypothetical protein M3Z09_12820 [Acidobacteriota bacterium]|nr:hypothetical protein [Acidobacteriota bacterium]
MPEKIYKLQPNRTIALRGFDALGASAALHTATADAFTVSGTFRDAADFAVLMLWDADNFYEHPRLKYLPDFNFDGAVLTFDVEYSPGLQPLDSPKSNWIDWATLDYITADAAGTSGKVRLWDNCLLKSGSFTAASGTFHLATNDSGIQAYDRLTVFFENLAYDYIAAPQTASVEYQFFATNGATQNITVNNRPYTHTQPPGGDSSADLANALLALVNAAQGDPDVTAVIGSTAYSILLTAKPGSKAVITASGNIPATLGATSVAQVAQALAQEINGTDWWNAYPTHALRATAQGNALTVTAARYGRVSTSGTAVTLTWSTQKPLTLNGAVFAGITPGAAITIAGVLYTVASVQSPTTLTLTTSAGTQPDALYTADRGGVDGNMIELYALHKTDSLKTTEDFVRLSAGNSDVTWTCTIDFGALGLKSLRQCWFTYAAALANSTAFTASEWIAAYTNWRLAGPESVTKLSVAGHGSVRVEESSSACTYTGLWSTPSPESGFFSGGLARRAGLKDAATNETLTVRYTCNSAHDLYLGTSLYTNSANIWVQLDGAPEFALSLYLNNEPAVNTRRLLVPAVPPGSHSVRFRIKDKGFFYFDFLEAAVLSDIPAPPAPRSNLAPALDYSTDHSWKLPPARILWILDNLGFNGPVNQYIGVFWWNQRTNPTAVFPSLTVTFPTTLTPGSKLKLTLGGVDIEKTVFPADTSGAVALHFSRFINELFVGAWASASNTSGTLTITVRSPVYSFSFDPHGLPTSGSLESSPATMQKNLGTWMVDPTQSPALNRGARDWHSDLYRECKVRNREVTTSGSMELVNPPDNFAARYFDGSPVVTSVGFGNLRSTHCAQSSPMLRYQQSVFDCIADLQNAAGLIPNFQLGEYLWWFFATSPTVGMAFYDSETAAAAQAALGRPLHKFLGPNDDPTVNRSADAVFLRNRLRDHVASIVSHIRSRYPAAQSEVLFAYDVNYPTQNDGLGGSLNRFINFPVEWGSHATAGFDRLKVEALAFGGRLRNLALARTAIEFPLTQDWPLSSVRYLAPIFIYSSTWEKEISMAFGLQIPIVNLWAFDQMCIFGLKINGYRNRSRSAKMG